METFPRILYIAGIQYFFYVYIKFSSVIYNINLFSSNTLVPEMVRIPTNVIIFI